MATVRVIEPIQAHRPKLRVGVCVRVSTDSEDQQNSYASQIGYYTKLIKERDDWELVDVYADEGITGTKLDKRDEFHRMMRDARKGKLDKILVKSVSRFARNTRDCLQSLRELKLLGVSVQFDRENLNTETLTTELMVSVSGSLAQEESVSISQNMRWSYQKRMQAGEFITCNAPFGYRIVDGKHLAIHEAEAEVVRWIFEQYLAGMNMYELAEAVSAMGFPTSEGTPYWQYTSINYLLQNEKYVGDSLGQKSCSSDTFPFNKMTNKGQKPQYYAENTHPAIIDRDTFERVQTLLHARRSQKDGPAAVYPLSRKMACGQCGTTFMRRVATKGLMMWVCRKHDHDKTACSVGRIPETEVYRAFADLCEKLKANIHTVIQPAISQLERLEDMQTRDNPSMLAINNEIVRLTEQNLLLSRLRTDGLIDPENYGQRINAINAKLAECKHRRRLISEAANETETLDQLRQLVRILNDAELTGAFDETLFEEVVEKVLVDSQEQIRFRLLGGITLTEQIRGKIR